VQVYRVRTIGQAQGADTARPVARLRRGSLLAATETSGAHALPDFVLGRAQEDEGALVLIGVLAGVEPPAPGIPSGAHGVSKRRPSRVPGRSPRSHRSGRTGRSR
jgi:hypothetical protein